MEQNYFIFEYVYNSRGVTVGDVNNDEPSCPYLNQKDSSQRKGTRVAVLVASNDDALRIFTIKNDVEILQ